MNWIKDLFIERDISLFQIFMWTFMASLCPPFDSVLNFIVAGILIGIVNYINNLVYDYTNKEIVDDLD